MGYSNIKSPAYFAEDNVGLRETKEGGVEKMLSVKKRVI